MLTLILAYSVVVLTSAYPNGAPLSTCESMEPNHRGSAQTSNSNIRIQTPNPNCFTPNQPLNLQISGGSFRGFLVQARAIGDSTPLGTFVPINSDSKTISCNGKRDSSLTHTNGNIKSITYFSWTPPINHSSPVIIRMTVVKDYSTYWSSVITHLNICTSTTTSKTTPLTTAFKALETSASKASSTKLSTVTKTILKTGATTIKTNIATTENKKSSLLYTTASSSRSTRLFFTTLAPAKTTTKTALPITISNTNSDKVTGYSTGKPVTATYMNKNTSSGKSTTKGVSRTTSKPGSCRDKRDCRRIEAVDCYSKEIQKSCCKTCNDYKAFYGNVADCPYGDKKRNCKNISMKRCFEDSGSNDEDDVVCCYSCKKYIKP